jgi:hypothetical protein
MLPGLFNVVLFFSSVLPSWNVLYIKPQLPSFRFANRADQNTHRNEPWATNVLFARFHCFLHSTAEELVHTH